MTDTSSRPTTGSNTTWDSLALGSGKYDPDEVYHVKYDKQGHTVNIGFAGGSFHVKKEIAARIEEAKQVFPQLKSNTDVLGNALVHWLNRPDIKAQFDDRQQRNVDLFTMKFRMVSRAADREEATEIVEMLDKEVRDVFMRQGEGVEELYQSLIDVSPLLASYASLQGRIDQLIIQVRSSYAVLLGLG